MEQLTACGWFEALPAEAAATIAAEIARCEASQRPLHEGLVAVVVDSRYLLAERPALELLDQFARASWGALRIDSSDQTRDGDGVVLRWVSGGRPYTLPLPNDLDEVPLTFFALVNRALADGGSRLRFQRVEQLPWGALESFVLTTPEALVRAADQRLVPVAPSAEPSDEELDRLATSIEEGLLGQQTYYWMIDQVTVGEVHVPEGFDVATADRRASGGGYETTLTFPDHGDVFLLCQGPTGSRLDPPRGLVLDGERHDTERSIRWGHGTTSVAWRIDDFAHVPLHVGCIVVEQLPKPFFDAVQSFRLLADPRDVEKLLDPTTCA